MKKILTTLTILFCFSFINAQSPLIKRADKYFKRTYYSKAISLYEKAIEDDKSFHIIKNLADSYYYLNNMNKASIHYKYLLKYYKELLDENYYLKYANTLKAKGRYKDAHKLLLKYYKKQNPDKFNQLQQEIEYLENVQALGKRFTIQNLKINTQNSEFGAIEKGESIVFAAPRKETTSKIFGWNNQPYLDLYTINRNQINQENSSASSFSNQINSKLHESNIVFTQNGKTAYFNRNNLVKGKRKTDEEKVTHIQLYKAEFIDGKWQNITPLPFNSNSYSTEHPALSPDEKTLYFSSDMPNGFGSFDLYSVEINNDGSFEVPKNLGPVINTPNKEQFPFISAKNKLYFSSDGHPSFGSLDVFVSSITTNGFSKPDNIGFPVNSGYDDFSFYINSNTKEGFFASNRFGGKGGDDIYKIVEQKPLKIEKCKQYVSGIITDIDTHAILDNATVIVYNKEGNKVISLQTKEHKKFRFTVNCQSTYIIKAFKTGYKENQKTLILKKERNKENDASLDLKSLIILEKEKATALALIQKREEELKRKNAEKLILQKTKKRAQIIANEKDIKKDKKGRIVIKTDEINFDYNLWYLRRDAKKAIDKVIRLMKKYPDMIVEVGTHSDIRGNNKYNLKLSQKRATSVRMYFMEQGIEPDRISAVGYGETQPLIKCLSEEACTEEQHEINRRCEFIIKKIL